MALERNNPGGITATE